MDSSSKLTDLFEKYKYKLPLAMGLVGLVLLIGGILSSGVLSKTFSPTAKPVPFPKESIVQNLPVVTVDISGAVVNPGVYKLGSGARVEEVIKAAGGITDAADPNYLAKSLNLAQKVADGMKIYIPKAGETLQSGSGQSVSSLATSGVVGVAGVAVVNLNTASTAELDTLPGVGPVTAQKIIDGRPYGGVEELLTRKIVSRSVFDKIKSLISI